MRVKRLDGLDQEEAKRFSEYLLRIGNGTETTYT